jgi:hypothetical protein
MKNIVSLRNLDLENKKFRNPSMRETIFFFFIKGKIFAKHHKLSNKNNLRVSKIKCTVHWCF